MRVAGEGEGGEEGKKDYKVGVNCEGDRAEKELIVEQSATWV